jgi:hypothetical protein
MGFDDGADPPRFRPPLVSITFARVKVAAGERGKVSVTTYFPVLATRAHSSIGQSPRLITGPFLVRTQVGPHLVRRLRAAGALCTSIPCL